jgi:hypothetical protein
MTKELWIVRYGFESLVRKVKNDFRKVDSERYE